MGVRFNMLVTSSTDHRQEFSANAELLRKSATDKMVFMSHKTSDYRAEQEAKRIAVTHRVIVYMAEWDDHINDTGSEQMPDYIMEKLRISDGFLVYVSTKILVSMWVGYEIGGAHVMGKHRARITPGPTVRLPSVVSALQSLKTDSAVDTWIRSNVLRSGYAVR